MHQVVLLITINGEMKLTLDDEQIEHIVLNSAKEAAEYRNTMEAMSIVAAEQKAKWDAKREERDKVAADQKAKWDADREKWERSATEMAERRDIAVMKTSESVKQMYGWQFNQTAAFETLVTSVLGKYLLTFGSTVEVSLSSKVLRKLPIVADVFKVGVEWDGVIFCSKVGGGRSTLYLVEAKTNINLESIVGMANRIRRTKVFVMLCAENKIKITVKNSALCGQWSSFYGADVRGVIGAHAFTLDTMTSAAPYIRICANDNAYHVVDIDGGEVLMDKNEVLQDI